MSINVEQFQPYPTPNTFDEAYKIVDELYLAESGLSFDLLSRKLELYGDKALQANQARILAIGETFNYLPGTDYQDTSRQHAFLDGYYATQPVISLAYNGAASFDALHKPIENWHHQALIKTEIEDNLVRQIRLIKLGEVGIKLIGEQANQILTEWSLELYPDDLQKAEIFRTGSGVLLAGSNIRQRAFNVATIKMETSGDMLDLELQSLIQSGGGNNES